MDGNRVFVGDFDETTYELMIPLINFVYSNKSSVVSRNLYLYINSSGGDAHRAFALVELIREAKARGITVHTQVLSDAHSAGSLVAVSGSVGHRKVAKRASYLVHYGEADAAAKSPDELARIYNAWQYHFETIRNTYTENTNIPVDFLDEVLSADNYHITAE